MEEQSSLTMTGKCFYINLSRRGDRRLAVEQELHTLGVEYERVPAVNARFVRMHAPYPTKERYACALSHRLAVRRAQRFNCDYVLIVEDDVCFAPGALKTFGEMDIPSDWGIFYFGCQHVERPIPIAANIVRVKKALDTHAYIIRSRYYKDVLRALRGQEYRKTTQCYGAALAMDTILGKLQARIPTYAAWPNIAWQSTNFSDITQSAYSNYAADGTQRAYREHVNGLEVDASLLQLQRKNGAGKPVDADVRCAAIEKLCIASEKTACDGDEVYCKWETLVSEYGVPVADGAVKGVRINWLRECVSIEEGWRAIAELVRILRTGGVVTISGWDLPQLIASGGTPRSGKAVINQLGMCASTGSWSAELVGAIFEAHGVQRLAGGNEAQKHDGDNRIFYAYNLEQEGKWLYIGEKRA